MKNEFIIKLVSFFYFFRWHPEVAIRYLPIVRKIKQSGAKTTVLEAGSGGLGITPYLRRKVTGLDLNFSYPYSESLEKVQGSILNIPFREDSFDIAISVDTFEHLKKEERKKALSELIRVARKTAIIAVPCGEDASKQDRELNARYREIHGRDYPFLSEQIENGLPREDEIINQAKEAAVKVNKTVSIECRDNEDLLVRNFLMRGWMRKGIFWQFIFKKLLLPFVFIMEKIDFKKGFYRKIFYIEVIK